MYRCAFWHLEPLEKWPNLVIIHSIIVISQNLSIYEIFNVPLRNGCFTSRCMRFCCLIVMLEFDDLVYLSIRLSKYIINKFYDFLFDSTEMERESGEDDCSTYKIGKGKGKSKGKERRRAKGQKPLPAPAPSSSSDDEAFAPRRSKREKKRKLLDASTSTAPEPRYLKIC